MELTARVSLEASFWKLSEFSPVLWQLGPAHFTISLGFNESSQYELPQLSSSETWSTIFHIVICRLGQLQGGLDTLSATLLSDAAMGQTLSDLDGNEVTHSQFLIIAYPGDW